MIRHVFVIYDFGLIGVKREKRQDPEMEAEPADR
jgi:hypothetical protein